MIFKPIPPFSGLTNLIMATCCTTNGVASVLTDSNFHKYETRGFVFKVR